MKKLLTSLMLAFALIAPHARAALIPTPDAPPAQNAERERVKALVARPDLAEQLKKMGIAPEEIQGRIDAMTDQEVHSLAGRLDAVPAGGDITTQEWLLIIIVILLVIIIL
jgi:hypothetical protein